MKRISFSIVLFAMGAVAFGCSVETKATDVICVPDQSNICTDCPTVSDPSHPQAYAGRHICAHDGKSFGACGQCAPTAPASPFSAITPPLTSPIETTPTPTAPSIDAACGGKLALLAGNQDPSVPFTYAASYDGAAFKVFSTNGAPMRSAASTSRNGNATLVAYRSKNDAIVTTSFSGGVWSPAATITAASTDGAPALASWGDEFKAIFRQSDGYYHVATYSFGSWDDGIELVGSSEIAPAPGVSEPSVVSTGAPGLPGASVMIGYTDNAAGLYRQEWNGDTWFSHGIKATTIEASAVRPEIIAMTSGGFDLVSTWVAVDGTLHASTRTSKDQGSLWSADALTDASATPSEAVHGIGLMNGRALVVFLDSAKKGQFMIFDPTKTPSWSAPAPLVPDANPVLASTPQLVADPCGAEATLALATSAGVSLLRFQAARWSEPVPVPGIPASTWASVVAIP